MNTLNEEKTEVVADNQKIVDLNNSLQRLLKNRDFKKLILEGYFKDEAARLVGLWSAPSTVEKNTRPQLIEDIAAISKLQDWFIVIESLATPMVYEDDDEEELNAQPTSNVL